MRFQYNCIALLSYDLLAYIAGAERGGKGVIIRVIIRKREGRDASAKLPPPSPRAPRSRIPRLPRMLMILISGSTLPYLYILGISQFQMVLKEAD